MCVITVNAYVFEFGRKSRVTAMVRPVSVYYFDFCFGRVSALFFEIVAHERKVCNRHGKPHFRVIRRNFLRAVIDKARKSFYVLRFNRLVHERQGLFERDLFAFHGVYKMLFNACKLFAVRALDRINGRALNKRALLSRQKLYALRGAVGALVVLSRKIRNCKNAVTLFEVCVFIVDLVHGGLGKYARHGGSDFFLRHPLDVVAD